MELCFLPCDLYCNLLKLYVQNNTMTRAKKRHANEENIKHSVDNEDPTDSIEKEERK